MRRGRPAPHRAPMPPLTPDALLARLDTLGIAHRTYTHPPVFTVDEAKALRGTLPGGHCKGLFLKDKKGGLWLVVALEGCRVDLKALRRAAVFVRLGRIAQRGARRAAR